jgi:hypothetical protein
MTPKELDAQSPIKIDRWVDVSSAECKELDDTYAFTKKCIAIGMEDKWMFVDSLGRIWGKSSDSTTCFPFHFEHGKQLIGYRLSTRAAN